MEIMDLCLSFIRPLFYFSQWVPKGFFRPSRGLRQGDPFSAFSFTIAVDSLSLIIFTVETKGLFMGFQVGSHKVNVFHLQFADDTLVLAEVNEMNVMVLKSLIQML